MFISTSLKFYKKPEVMNQICEQAEHKEIGVMFGISKFGKRPDMINYPNDILEFAKKKVSSFHCSEESWDNPLSISSGMKRKELDELRIGWDFILDIDCPIWEFSKLTTHLFIEVLRKHNIKGITCKFSGNKGFHIAVPFESFPYEIIFEEKLRKTKDLFPELPRIIAKYILDYVETELISIKDNEILFIDKNYSFEELKKMFKLDFKEITYKKCAKCNKIKNTEEKIQYEFLCESCGNNKNIKEDKQFITCDKCKSIMRKINIIDNTKCDCGSTEFTRRLNLSKIIEVDTILIASRHMYRMPYSLHEKSELVSIPIKINEVLTFEKERAKPENVKFNIEFLNRKVENDEAKKLIEKALKFNDKDIVEEKIKQKIYTSDKKNFEDYEIDQDAIPEEYFPPCIKLMNKGLEDGRKRILFALVNFLNSLNWSFDKIDEYVHEWNKTNEEELRENSLKSQINYRKQREKILPPNCDTPGYYKDLGVCIPDEFCGRIKNPAQYSKLKSKLNKKKPRKKKVDDKKEIKKKNKQEIKKEEEK